jgi:hypothetical protein
VGQLTINTRRRGDAARTTRASLLAGGILTLAERLAFTPDAAQSALLTTPYRRVILNCTRQWGKTTVTALRVVWHALTVPGSLTVIAAPAERQSGEFVDKARSFLDRLNRRVRGDGHNRCSILLDNGSRIAGIPNRQATTRGFSGVTFLVIDEASRAPEALYVALRPMLATTNGSLWLLSTPNGKRGFFYKVWQHGGPNWLRVSVPASECPRISAEFLEEERQSIDEQEFREEYCCEFLLGDDYLFDRDILERAVDREQHAWKDLPL